MKPAAEFKRKVLLFYCLARRCFNCSKIDFSLDIDTEVVIDPVLKKPICYNCKMSEKFRMISATSAGRKYHVDKKDIDMLNLDFFDVPNPYYTAKKMKLYYEYQIVENLPKIQKWRDFKRQKIQASAKVWRDEKKKMRDEKKIHQTLLALEIEFRREHRGAEKALLTRDQIEEKYINDPLMDLYLNEKTKMQLAQIVDLIDEGKSKKYIQRMQEQQERLKLMRTPEGREAFKRLREKEDKKKGKKGKKDKKKKKETKKEKEARIEKERRKEMAKSTISNRHKDVSARNEKEFDKKRREKEQKKIKERMKKLKKKSKVDSSDDDD
ncbi:hypothetical protein FGO68_gene14668 [Halteria grandinella]|uniref:Uncharacterized protein n=1 Tax=Halteria grandinella TaxID=5974 RepID=A0A8J8T480_HALGN|nr:hypothetical protein FGO68_gene14668 [Halteria grandinella]